MLKLAYLCLFASRHFSTYSGSNPYCFIISKISISIGIWLYPIIMPSIVSTGVLPQYQGCTFISLISHLLLGSVTRINLMSSCAFSEIKSGTMNLPAKILFVQVRSVLILKGQESSDHSVEDYSTTPNVSFAANVFFASNHFRSCISR